MTSSQVLFYFVPFSPNLYMLHINVENSMFTFFTESLLGNFCHNYFLIRYNIFENIFFTECLLKFILMIAQKLTYTFRIYITDKTVRYLINKYFTDSELELLLGNNWFIQ